MQIDTRFTQRDSAYRLEPVGRQLVERSDTVSGTYGGGKPLQLSRKKFAYVGPVGNTAFLGRERRVHQEQIAYRESSFGKIPGHIGLLEVGEKSHMGGIGAEIRPRTFVRRPPKWSWLIERQKEKRGGYPPLFYQQPFIKFLSSAARKGFRIPIRLQNLYFLINLITYIQPLFN